MRTSTDRSSSPTSLFIFPTKAQTSKKTAFLVGSKNVCNNQTAFPFFWIVKCFMASIQFTDFFILLSNSFSIEATRNQSRASIIFPKRYHCYQIKISGSENLVYSDWSFATFSHYLTISYVEFRTFMFHTTTSVGSLVFTVSIYLKFH